MRSGKSGNSGLFCTNVRKVSKEKMTNYKYWAKSIRSFRSFREIGR